MLRALAGLLGSKLEGVVRSRGAPPLYGDTWIANFYYARRGERPPAPVSGPKARRVFPTLRAKSFTPTKENAIKKRLVHPVLRTTDAVQKFRMPPVSLSSPIHTRRHIEIRLPEMRPGRPALTDVDGRIGEYRLGSRRSRPDDVTRERPL